MKLQFGGGPHLLPGYTRVDVRQQRAVDVPWNLNDLPWPLDDDRVRMIVASNVVEQLELNLVKFCEEAWRVLKPGGELFIRTPHHDGAQSWIDPQHRWHLHERSFEYFDPQTELGRQHPHYTSKKWQILSLGIRQTQQIHVLMTPRK